ncbi:hypothetical protein ACFXKR_11910 [Streptomyces violascens]|uniref:hypothetical protein n=1 Tax=Streptomyces violascens TaxID=67381 RepID=UPI0036BBAD58
MVQRAYGVLEREGLLVRRQGQLWQIVGAPDDAHSDVSYEDVAARIRLWLKDHPEEDVLPAGADLAREYEVSVDAVAQARQLLFIDGTLSRASRRFVRATSGRLSRVDEVIQEIRAALAAEPDHVAPGGEPIGEKAWMERCAANKKTVQGALAKLEAEGIVTAPKPGKGRRLISR